MKTCPSISTITSTVSWSLLLKDFSRLQELLKILMLFFMEIIRRIDTSPSWEPILFWASLLKLRQLAWTVPLFCQRAKQSAKTVNPRQSISTLRKKNSCLKYEAPSKNFGSNVKIAKEVWQCKLFAQTWTALFTTRESKWRRPWKTRKRTWRDSRLGPTNKETLKINNSEWIRLKEW